jgi:SPP1 family predicted phage head-tail adaptor
VSDAIGAMRARITLQSPMRVADEIGGTAIAWLDQGDAWAAIEALSAGEAAAYDVAVSTSAHRVTINRSEGARAGWRVLWGDRVLRIAGVRDDGAARIELVCEEEIR